MRCALHQSHLKTDRHTRTMGLHHRMFSWIDFLNTVTEKWPCRGGIWNAHSRWFPSASLSKTKSTVLIMLGHVFLHNNWNNSLKVKCVCLTMKQIDHNDRKMLIILWLKVFQRVLFGLAGLHVGEFNSILQITINAQMDKLTFTNIHLQATKKRTKLMLWKTTTMKIKNNIVNGEVLQIDLLPTFFFFGLDS